MKTRRYITLLTLSLLFAASWLVVLPSSAQAVSIYDNVVKIEPELKLHYESPTCNPPDTDLSTTWAGRIGTYLSTTTSEYVTYQQKQDWINKEHWGVTTAELPNTEGGTATRIQVWYTTSPTMQGNFSTWNGYSYLAYEAPYSIVFHQITITPTRMGGAQYACSSDFEYSGRDVMSVATFSGPGPLVGSNDPSFGGNWKQFLHTPPVVYPSGYDGKYIPRFWEPPTTLYTGTVDCGVDSVEYMLITQDGNTNPVTFTEFESQYRAHWSHYLTSSPYSITVGCGDEVAASVGSVDPATSSNDWICITPHTPPYCVLS